MTEKQRFEEWWAEEKKKHPTGIFINVTLESWPKDEAEEEEIYAELNKTVIDKDYGEAICDCEVLGRHCPVHPKPIDDELKARLVEKEETAIDLSRFKAAEEKPSEFRITCLQDTLAQLLGQDKPA